MKVEGKGYVHTSKSYAFMIPGQKSLWNILIAQTVFDPATLPAPIQVLLRLSEVLFLQSKADLRGKSFPTALCHTATGSTENHGRFSVNLKIKSCSSKQ